MLAGPGPASASTSCRALRPAAAGAPRSSELEERAEELLARFKLDHMRDEFAGTLSGGQRKLLEMAGRS